MIKEIKERWVEALRSGKYQQGSGYLLKDDKYCCLGVLCELAVEDRIISKDTEVERNIDSEKSIITLFGDNSEWRTAFLPKKVANWSCLFETNFNYNGTNKDLITLNDDGVPFTTIADLIEKNFNEL